MMIPADLTPAQFEEHVKAWLLAAGQTLASFDVMRLESVAGSSGEYEIDVTARFVVFGEAEIQVLVECKHHKHPIKRDIVMVLESKLRDTKANKGMIFSTAPFQRGALTFAENHRIATLHVSDAGIQYMTKSFASERPATTPGSAVAWLCTANEEGTQFSIVSGRENEKLGQWLISA